MIRRSADIDGITQDIWAAFALCQNLSPVIVRLVRQVRPDR